MNVTETLLEILKFTIPSVVVLVGTSFIVNKFLISQIQRKQLAIFQDAQDTTLRFRLQAYERLVLFLERISPRQLIPRVYDSEMTVLDLQQMMTYTITTEFEHNLSQQIYISKNGWETVKSIKEQEINMINNIGRTLDPDAPAKELHARIMEYLLRTEGQTPTEVGLIILNDEVRKIMSFGSV